MLGAVFLGAVVGRCDRHAPWACCCGGSRSHPDDVARLTKLVADGRRAPAIDRRYPLDQVVEALRYVNDGHARGKVLVLPGGTDGPAS